VLENYNLFPKPPNFILFVPVEQLICTSNISEVYWHKDNDFFCPSPGLVYNEIK
jgi:hypothetical protein